MRVNFFDRDNNLIHSDVLSNEEDAKAWARFALKDKEEYATAEFWQDDQFCGTMREEDEWLSFLRFFC